MIYDSLTAADRYRALHPLFGRCFAYLASPGVAELSEGRHEIGGGAHALVSGYATKNRDTGIIECHRRFIDIQLVAVGEELVGVVPRNRCAASAYDAQRDFEKLDGPVDFITLKPGLFALFFPGDGHMPGISSGESAATIRKVVIKVPVAESA